MEHNSSIQIDEELLHKLIEIKNEMGYKDRNWDDWLSKVFSFDSSVESTKQTLERVFEENTYKRYYDEWIQNFALNLQNIWKDHSAKELTPQNKETKNASSALVIGRGPSLKRYNHLEFLSTCNYKGTILCCDGALIPSLKAGVTPDKFENYFVVTIDSQTRQQACYNDPIVKKFGKKIKCLLSTTVSPVTYSEIKKSGIDVFWVHTLVDYDKGKNSFNYISGTMSRAKKHHKGIPAIQTGGNVGTSAWIIAWAILKKTHVGLIGIDHGYYSEDRTKDDHIFPENIDKTSSAFKKAYPTIHNPIFNCTLQQDPIFQYYSNALKEFISRMQDKVKTINATEGGAIFGNKIECITLKNFIKKYNF